MVAIGEIAPDFELESSSGGRVRLSGARGHPVILYFFPKADTPGCTIESKAFRDMNPDLEGKGVKVLGISVDALPAQQHFAQKCSLPFPLLADPSKSVTQAFGVLGRSGTARRVTFFIGPDGKIVDVVDASGPGPHTDRARSRFLGSA